MNLSTLVPSLIRTWAPILAGWLLSLPLARPILDALNLRDTLHVSAAVAAGLGALYYLLVRLVEERFPAASYLLGNPTKPTYPSLGAWSLNDIADVLQAHQPAVTDIVSSVLPAPAQLIAPPAVAADPAAPPTA